MDDLVKQAMAKWPHVPDCRGWLGLDARGEWYMRDDRTQAQGPFPQGTGGTGVSSVAKGSRLLHDKLVAFIGRNYASDGAGQWYFQNGPQRVYVELACAPWVWRLNPQGGVSSHTGLPASVLRCLCDEAGHLYWETDLGLGLVHTMDMVDAVDWMAERGLACEEVRVLDLPTRFGFVLSPAAAGLAA